MVSSDTATLTGREKLMKAAMELAATSRSLANLGLRELSRHAGLNPNTFYRHFRDFDDLGLAMLNDLGQELRTGLRERRMQPAHESAPDFNQPEAAVEHAQSVARESVRLVLDFVLEHRDAYVAGIRELFGTSPVLRQAMRDLLDGIAQDITEDIFTVLPIPNMPKDDLTEIAHIIVRQMVFFSMDTIEQPERRDEIHREAERFILLIFWGAIAARMPELLTSSKLRFPDI